MKSDVGFPVGLGGGLRTILPADLVAVVLVTIVADAVVLAGTSTTLGFAAAGVLLFFLPGYAIVAALYPGATPEGGGADGRSGIGFLERLALSFGASVAAVAILGLVAYQVGAANGATGVSTTVVLWIVTLAVIGGSAVAAIRRLRRPQEDRFAPPYGEWAGAIRATAFGGASRRDRALNVALALSVLLGTGMLGYAVASPAANEQYTTASLLTERADGELVAGGYPDELEPGEATELVLELGNNEGVDTTYTAVVRVERVDGTGADATVTEASELDRLSVAVPAGETRTVPHEVAPELTGEQLRLSYYVYRGDAPSEPSASSAYRHLYVWISVASA